MAAVKSRSSGWPETQIATSGGGCAIIRTDRTFVSSRNINRTGGVRELRRAAAARGRRRQDERIARECAHKGCGPAMRPTRSKQPARSFVPLPPSNDRFARLGGVDLELPLRDE